jgi:hypothetical protein
MENNINTIIRKATENKNQISKIKGYLMKDKTLTREQKSSIFSKKTRKMYKQKAKYSRVLNFMLENGKFDIDTHNKIYQLFS